MAAEGEVAAGWVSPPPAEVAVTESWWLAAGAGGLAACEEHAIGQKRSVPIKRVGHVCLHSPQCANQVVSHLVQSYRVPGATWRAGARACRIPVSTAPRVIVSAGTPLAGSAAGTWRSLQRSKCQRTGIEKVSYNIQPLAADAGW